MFVPARGSSIVEVTRFQFQRFTVGMKELAEWFGERLRSWWTNAWLREGIEWPKYLQRSRPTVNHVCYRPAGMRRYFIIRLDP